MLLLQCMYIYTGTCIVHCFQTIMLLLYVSYTHSQSPPYIHMQEGAGDKRLGSIIKSTCMHGSQFYHCRIADALIEIQDIPLIQELERYILA
jgi:hypothetical protein